MDDKEKQTKELLEVLKKALESEAVRLLSVFLFLLSDYSGFPLPCAFIIHLKMYIVKLISSAFRFFSQENRAVSRPHSSALSSCSIGTPSASEKNISS